MRKCLILTLVICLILTGAFMLSACDDGITDAAYVQFLPSVDGEVVQYTSYMYADDGTKAHIYLFENEKAKNEKNTFGTINYVLKISFNRGFGIDYEIDEKETFVVPIDGRYSMSISIKKDYYIFFSRRNYTQKGISQWRGYNFKSNTRR